MSNRFYIPTGAERINIGKRCVNFKEEKPRTILQIIGYNKKQHTYKVKDPRHPKAHCFINAENAFFRDDDGNLLN